MQCITHPPEEVLAFFQSAMLGIGEETPFDQVSQRRVAKVSLSNPTDILDVPQRTRAPFDIGF